MNLLLILLLVLIAAAAVTGYIRFALKELSADGFGHNLPPRSHSV